MLKRDSGSECGKAGKQAENARCWGLAELKSSESRMTWNVKM